MSEPANGNNTVILLARESAWATEGTIPRQILIKPGGGMVGDQALIPSELIGGNPNPRDAVAGKQSASGDFETYPNVDSIGFLMEMGLGSRIFATGAHTSKIVAGALPSFSMDESMDLAAATKYKRSLGVRVDKLGFTWAADGFLSTKFTLLAKSVTQQSTYLGTPTVPIDYTTQPVYDHLMAAAADVKLNGTSVSQIISGSLDISHNHFPDHYVFGGAGVRRSLPRRRATVNGKIKTFFEDTVIYALAKAGTYVALDLKWTNGAASFQLVVPRVRLKPTDPKIPNGPLEVEFSFEASYDGTALTSVKTVTTNTKVDLDYST
jgi:Phage tail tube protein